MINENSEELIMLDKVIEVIARELAIEEELVSAESDIIEDLCANSLDIVSIITALEDTYGLTVPDEAIIDLRTPALIVNYIEQAAGSDENE